MDGRRGYAGTCEVEVPSPAEVVGLLTVSPAMLALKETAARIADSDVTVLIHGESGVGKELLARYIHEASPAPAGPFVKVNCAALPEELLESELFGYERGAFTGASSQKPGRFELAGGGTILLDEISEMRLSLQSKLLHVLQDGVFTRLGGTREMRCDARICSATNANLEEAIENGRFREDLYFRLKVIDLWVPPLRQRREDILLLSDHFLKTFAFQYNRPLPVLSERFRLRLLEHPWPGNVRELINIMKGVVVMGDIDWALAQLDDRAHRPVRYGGSADAGRPHLVSATSGDGDVVVDRRGVHEPPPAMDLREISRRASAAAERVAILGILQATGWNRRRAARLLRVSYKTLLSKIKSLDLKGPPTR
jgi:two-component system, NtrC family, response regulator AtoC